MDNIVNKVLARLFAHRIPIQAAFLAQLPDLGLFVVPEPRHAFTEIAGQELAVILRMKPMRFERVRHVVCVSDEFHELEQAALPAGWLAHKHRHVSKGDIRRLNLSERCQVNPP